MMISHVQNQFEQLNGAEPKTVDSQTPFVQIASPEQQAINKTAAKVVTPETDELVDWWVVL